VIFSFDAFLDVTTINIICNLPRHWLWQCGYTWRIRSTYKSYHGILL